MPGTYAEVPGEAAAPGRGAVRRGLPTVGSPRSPGGSRGCEGGGHHAGRDDHGWFDGLDLLVSNASVLGAEPLVRLDALPLEGLRRALETNVVAALGLVQEALPSLRASAAGTVVVISSDAAAEPYPTWGGYGASKAVLGEEEPGLRVWAVDPGDMATDLYAAAVPEEANEVRPTPESVAPAFLRLVRERPASGRFAAPALLEEASGPGGGSR
ncbi:SDR family NAD(P)-dependent oxidoreductase [Streptomyces anulatus]|uniref:SDR family NAD(P)-dependent oxidoreductase n=1 Tax=Streptomyces anulatus TaxID=1892 RepID=UPI00370285DA